MDDNNYPILSLSCDTNTIGSEQTESGGLYQEVHANDDVMNVLCYSSECEFDAAIPQTYNEFILPADDPTDVDHVAFATSRDEISAGQAKTVDDTSQKICVDDDNVNVSCGPSESVLVSASQLSAAAANSEPAADVVHNDTAESGPYDDIAVEKTDLAHSTHQHDEMEYSPNVLCCSGECEFDCTLKQMGSTNYNPPVVDRTDTHGVVNACDEITVGRL